MRYYQSWLEDTTSLDELISDMSITDKDEIEEFNQLWAEYDTDHKSDKMIMSMMEDENDEEENSVMFGDNIVFEDNSDIIFMNESGIEENENFIEDLSSSEMKLHHKSS